MLAPSVLLSLELLRLASLSHAWRTFSVPHVAGSDDTPGLMAALENYTSNATILFEKGVTYNVFTPITFPILTNVEVNIQGNLSYPTDIPTIQSKALFTINHAYNISQNSCLVDLVADPVCLLPVFLEISLLMRSFLDFPWCMVNRA